MPSELEPCPFCGGEAKLIHPMGYWIPNGPPHYSPDGSRVTCTSSALICCASSAAFYGPDQDAEALAAWNTRTSPPATQAEWDAAIERLEQSTSRLSGELHAAIATQADDDALVEVRDAIRTYFPTEMACAAVVCAILPIIAKREAAAFEQGLAIGKSSAKGNYDAGYAKGRAETIAGAIAAQPSTDYDVIGAYERGHLRGVADFVEALCAIERGQHGSKGDE